MVPEILSRYSSDVSLLTSPNMTSFKKSEVSLPSTFANFVPQLSLSSMKTIPIVEVLSSSPNVKNVQWYHLYVSRGLIKPIKSAFINKSNTKFSCPISLVKSVTKTNIKILINDIYP